MGVEDNEAVQRVRSALEAGGCRFRLLVLARSGRSAEEAAAAIGCEVARIAESVVFPGAASDRPVLVVASGPTRVDQTAVAALVGEPLARADADHARARTGFAIGGVAPLAHVEPPVAVVDRGLMVHATVWAAAGHPRAVFEVAPVELVRMSGGRVDAIA